MEEIDIQIKGYKISKVLGQGGMASVYLAIQESFEREVAIKIMSKQLASDPSFGERFIREAKIVSRLVHPHIVTVYDVGIENNHHFLSMEYIPGDDLKNKLHTISLIHILKVIKEVAMALDFAGRKGYVHRDIKPENIMINNEDGRAVLMDFGIAKAFDSVSGMTQTGTAIGTPYYMSPEQAKGKEVDWRSDLYSLGVVFYQLLVGKVPYDGDSAIAVGIKHLSNPIPKLPEFLQPAFQGIIDKLLAKTPDERYQNGVEFVNALNNIDPNVIMHLNEHFDEQGTRDSSFHYNSISTPITSSSGKSISVHTGATQVVSMPTDISQVPKINLSNDDRRQPTTTNSSSPLKFVMAGVVVIALSAAGYFYFESTKESELTNTTQNKKDDIKKLANNKTKDQTNNTTEETLVENNEVSPTPETNNNTQQKVVDNKPSQNTKNATALSTAQLAQQEKLAELINKTQLLEAELASNIQLVEQLHQNYQLITVLDENHPVINKGYTKIKQSLIDEIAKNIQQKDFDSADTLLKQKLNIFPDLALAEHILALRERIDFELQIKQLLTKGNQLLSADKLTGTDDDNAEYYFNQVLALSTDNNKAISGLQAISERYLTLANAMLEQNKLEQALTYIARGSSIARVKNDKLETLKQNITAQQKNQQQQIKATEKLNALLDTANNLLNAGNLITPQDNNALQSYRAVLTLDANNEAALKGISTIEHSINDEVEQLINFKDFDLAQQKLDQALVAIPASALFQASQTLLTQNKQQAIDASQPKILRVIIKGREFNEMTDISTKKFSADRTVYIGIKFDNFGSETSVLQAVLYDGSRTVKISTVPVIISGNSGDKYFKISRPVDGFAQGGYHLDLILNNNNLISEQFSIEN